PSGLWFVAAVGLLVALVIPQLVYDAFALRARLRLPRGFGLTIPGFGLMVPYGLLAVWLARRLLRATRRSQVQLYVAYALCGVAGLAKGLVGVGLPGLVLLLHLAMTGDARRTLRRLEIWTGVAIVVVVAFPWYHAMLIRHGLPFWNELFGDNHW